MSSQDNLFSSHSMIFASAGTGRSLLTASARKQARQNDELLVDTELYRNGSGLRPYEHEYARRVTLGLTGPLPRALRGKAARFISDVTRETKRKRDTKETVTTPNGIVLDRAWIGEAREQLELQTGVWLTHRQLIELMAEFGIDETLAEYEEVETQIRESLADALSRKLIGRSWPTGESLKNALEKSAVDFAVELNAAAKKAGFIVR